MLDGLGQLIVFMFLLGLVVGLPIGVSVGWFIWG